MVLDYVLPTLIFIILDTLYGGRSSMRGLTTLNVSDNWISYTGKQKLEKLSKQGIMVDY
jgi:hypothetical protein